MENENETLDWGNEDEEQQVSYRRASNDYASRQEADADADGPGEDTISLGDEEEDGYYFQRNEALSHPSPERTPEETYDRPESPPRRADSVGANEPPRYQHDSRDKGYYERSPSRSSYRRHESPPPRDQDRPPRNQISPTQTATTRLKHALPPKPATAKVPYLPPSHPSIVAATSMTDLPSRDRDPPRDAKANGAGPGRPATPTDVPHPWVQPHSRSANGNYQYNTEGDETSWYPPVSNIPSSSSGQYRRRTRSGSSTDPFFTTSDSNLHQTQTSRPRADRSVPHSRPEFEAERPDRAERAESDLTHGDRHYRPNGEPVPDSPAVVHETHPVSRNVPAPNGRYPPRSRYERSPPPSPRPRRRARSISPPSNRTPPTHTRARDYPPPPPRASHPAPRERQGYTNPSVSHRDADMTPRDRWGPSHIPPHQFDRSDRPPHKPPQRPVDTDRSYGHTSHDQARPPLRRRESSREPVRDRHPRHPDVHDHQPPAGNKGFISAPRYPREREIGRDYPPYREPPPASGPPNADRKERLPPFERSASSHGPPPNIAPPPHDRESFNGNPRGREYDNRPPPVYDQRRRDNERDYHNDRDFERPTRDGPPDVAPPRRHDDGYPPRDAPHSAPARSAPRYPDPYERPPPEDPAQLSHRRRQPLPPQATTYMSAPGGREPAPPPPPPPVQEPPPVLKPPGWANFDPTLPRRPKLEAKKAELAEREKAAAAALAASAANHPAPPPGSRPTGPSSRPAAPVATAASSAYDDRRNNGPKTQDRGRQDYPQRGPRLDTRMDIDPRESTDGRRAPSPPPRIVRRVTQEDVDRGRYFPDIVIDHFTGKPLPEPRPAMHVPTWPPTPVLPPPPPKPRHEPRFSTGFQQQEQQQQHPPAPGDRGRPDGRWYNDAYADRRENRSANGYHERGGPERGGPERGSERAPERGPMPMHPRRDFRGRPDEPEAAPSGANNFPIGNRRSNPPGPVPGANGRPSLPPNGILPGGPPPQAFGFNPDARPPPSALMRPAQTSEYKQGPESYNRPPNPPAPEQQRRNLPSAPPQSEPASIDRALIKARTDSANRRASRFAPLVHKTDMAQEQPSPQTAGRSSEDQPQRIPTPPAQVSREPTAGRYSEAVQSEGRRSPQNDARDRSAGQRDDNSPPTWSADASSKTKTSNNAQSDRMGSSQTASTISAESTSSQRPKYKWSEQMANAAAPGSPETFVETDLSRRLSSEKPPRHRKYTASRFVTDEMAVDAPASDPPSAPETNISFKDRLENPSLSRRNSNITLLDRLSSAHGSAPEPSEAPTPSLRDRLVPSKRDREEVDAGESGSYEDDDNENKRIKRRNTKAKRGGRR